MCKFFSHYTLDTLKWRFIYDFCMQLPRQTSEKLLQESNIVEDRSNKGCPSSDIFNTADRFVCVITLSLHCDCGWYCNTKLKDKMTFNECHKSGIDRNEKRQLYFLSMDNGCSSSLCYLRCLGTNGEFFW
jgi:hypothetical protein